MDYTQMTSPCGRDCFNCPLYLARDNERFQKIVAKKMGIPVENAVCQGCRNEKGVIPFLNEHGTCNLFQCVVNKGVTLCFECSDFPCDYLHPVADKASELPHNTKLFNLLLIKKMGVDAWAEKKAKGVFDTYFKKKLVDLFL